GLDRLHVDATLPRRNHLVQAGVPRFQVEIGHTVDGRSIPTAGARVRDAWNVGTDLGRQATEGTQQAAIANEVLALRRLAIVVEAVAHILLGPGRVEGDVEEIRAGAV